MRREGWDEEKAISKLFHMNTQATAFSQGGGPQKYGEALYRVDAVGLKRFLVGNIRYFTENLKLSSPSLKF